MNVVSAISNDTHEDNAGPCQIEHEPCQFVSEKSQRDSEESEMHSDKCATDNTDSAESDYSDSDSNESLDNSDRNYSFHFDRFNCDALDGNTIMFPASGLTVSDVLLMATSYFIKKRSTKKDQDDFINFIKVLAGPGFENWSASHYKRAKIYDPPRDKITLHFYCESCSVPLMQSNFEDTFESTDTVCVKCKKEQNVTLHGSNYFLSIDVAYQIQMILNDKTVQDSLFHNIDHNLKDRNETKIQDIYDSLIYKRIQEHSKFALTYNSNFDGAPLFKS